MITDISKMEVLSVYFNRTFFTTIECRKYLLEHKLVPILRTIRTDTDFVYVIQDEKNFTNKIKKNVGNKIIIKYGYF